MRHETCFQSEGAPNNCWQKDEGGEFVREINPGEFIREHCHAL